MKIKREPSFLQKAIPKIKQMILPGAPADWSSKTPLPPTPGVDAKQFAKANQNITPSGLTTTEDAWLSNEEKAMRLRSKGMA